MMHTTLWSPDTCGCSIRYSWDTETSEDERVHTFHSVEQRCDAHSGLANDKIHYQHILGENQTKNKVHGAIMDVIPRLKKQQVQPDGTTADVLDPVVQFNWSFKGKDHRRELHVSFAGVTLSKAEVNKLTAAVANLDKPVTIH
jgi:hypothetical protein